MLDNGYYFSDGQRSMISLSRALLLKRNKILILDEATANLDTVIDNLLHKTIRKHFAHCTILTIAHRLNTIMDSDRVLVLDAGEIVEFDHAHRLLQNANGFLSKLVNETGSMNAQHLIEVAKQSYDTKCANIQKGYGQIVT